MESFAQALWQANGNNIAYTNRTVAIGKNTPSAGAMLDVNGQTQTLSLIAQSANFATAVVTGQFSAGDITITNGSISSSSGSISFGNNNLSTTGNINAGSATLAGQLTTSNITSSGGTINFGSNNLTTTGNISSANISSLTSSVSAQQSQISNLNTQISSIVSSQWTTNPDSSISFNGNVFVKNLNVSDAVSIGSFRFSNGSKQALPYITDSIRTPFSMALSSAQNISLDADNVTLGNIAVVDRQNAQLNVTGNISASGNISSGTLTSNSITTSQLTINGGLLEADTMHARNRLAVNNSLLLSRESTNDFAEVSTIDTSVSLVLQKSQAGRGVGIGITPSIGEKLSVSGNVGITNGSLKISSLSGSGNKLLFADSVGNLKTSNISLLAAPWEVQGNTIVSSDYIGTNNAEDFVIKTDAQGLGGERMRITSTGNIGIGTIPNTLGSTQKNYKVDINGDFRVLTGGTAGNGNGIVLKTEIDNTTPPGGIPEAMVGIGTEDPLRALHILTAHFSGLPPPPPPCPICPPLLTGTHMGIRMEDISGSIASPAKTLWDFIPIQGNLYFSKGNPNNPHANDAKMTILSNGNVGIGTAAPGTLLEVAGSISIYDGNANTSLFFARDQVSNKTFGKWGIQYIPSGTLSPQAKGGLNFWIPSAPGNNFGNNYLFLADDGNVGIGVSNPQNKLEVCGQIHAKEVVIENNSWCDYVFDKNYNRMTWQEKLSFINVNKHLPAIASGKEIETNGLKTGETMQGMMQNIEENTLDVIDLYQIIQKQNQEIELLKKEVAQMKEKK